MKKTEIFLPYIICVSLLLFANTVKTQTFYNNGAVLCVKNGAHVFVDGYVQNQTGQISVNENSGVNSEFIIQDDFINNSIAGGDGYYRVLGDWVNNNTFNAGTGTVFLEGGNQLLGGSVSTTFNNLTLDGTGLKTQTIDHYCVGILDLKTLELQNETHGFFVQNPDVNAVIRNTGFVSALDGGFLSRETNSSASYLFPVGSSVGTLRYRPVEISPENTSINTYAVRMANVDATTEGYDRDLTVTDICEINSLFYHQIDRTDGSAAIDLSIFYDESTDGAWEGISNWTSIPEWDIITGSTTFVGIPLDGASAAGWSGFSEISYALYNATPDATITDPGDFCSTDAAIDLTAATAGGTWIGTGITDATNGTFDPSVANIGANNITYEITVAGCTGTDNITINIAETPDATITNPGIICITDAAFNLDAATNSGLWAGDGITDNNAGTFDPSVAGLGVHLITYQVINGSCNDSDQINIEVIDTPEVSITPVGPFCQNDPSVNLQAATPGGTWTGPGIIDETNGTFNPSQANIGENIITYTVSIEACAASAQVNIQVIESENASITPVGPFCYDEFTVQLDVDNYGGNWYGAHVDNYGVFNVETAGPGTHTVFYTIPGGCGDSDIIQIVVHPANFVVDYSLQQPSCYGGDNASIDFSVLGGTSPYNYTWGAVTSDTSYIDGLTAGTYQFNISDANGCEVNVETITIFDGSRDCLRIPNAFTPNGDDVNDTFIIENLEFYPNSYLQIFNRWGQVLYEGTPNSEPWDGTYNGNPLPTGSYIFVLSLRRYLDDVTGIVTLVR